MMIDLGLGAGSDCDGPAWDPAAIAINSTPLIADRSQRTAKIDDRPP